MLSLFPQVLCLHIKRFRWCNSYRSKVDTQVDFPMESLDMSAFTVRGVTGTRLGAQNSHLYDLAAVIVHHGSGYVSLLDNASNQTGYPTIETFFVIVATNA